MIRAGKRVTGSKRGKICNRFQAREFMQPVPGVGKHAAGVKREKLCNPVPGAGNHVTGAKRVNEARKPGFAFFF